VVGNVTLDLHEDGSWTPGGPSLYSSLMAAALGMRVTLVSRIAADYPVARWEGVELCGLPAASAPRYANTYDASGRRSQLLLAKGEPIGAKDLAVLAGTEADLLIVAPAYHELRASPRIRARYAAVSLQGLLRVVRADRVGRRMRTTAQLARFLRPGWFAFLSAEDASDPGALARSVVELGASAVVTDGALGARRFGAAGAVAIEPVRSAVIDPTGAGDCFATAFMVRLAETGDLHEAGRYGAAAGSLVIEGPGLAGIPSRRAIEERLLREAA
jgi:sugar/nucleoside kinase (ribokinase family)